MNRRTAEEERIQKEWATQRWRQNVRPQEDLNSELQLQEQEELRRVQLLMEKSLKNMEPRLPQIKLKLDTTPQLHKIREAFAQFEDYIINPALVHTCQRYKILQLLAFTRKIDQLLETSKKLAGDAVQEFKRQMGVLLKTVAKLESSKDTEATSVITLRDLKDQHIKVDDFFNSQNVMKIDNSLETCLKTLVFCREDSPPEGFVNIKREQVIEGVEAYKKKSQAENNSQDERPEDETNQGDEFTNHMLEDFKRIHDGYNIKSVHSGQNKFLKIKVSKKQMPELGEIVILIDANSHFIFVKDTKFFKEVIEQIDKEDTRDLFNIVECWYHTLYAKCRMNG